jgi:hypothetical protein
LTFGAYAEILGTHTETGNTVRIRGGPAAVIGDGCLLRAKARSLSRLTSGGRPQVSSRSESQKTCRRRCDGDPMAKGTRMVGPSRARPVRVFLWDSQPDTTKEVAMTRKSAIISYRRRCRKVGQGTGLSHYILWTPKETENK